MDDVLAGLGPVFLGSRLKRLGERLQAGAAQVLAEAGLPLQPAHMPLVVGLGERPMRVTELAEAVGLSQPAVTRSAGQLAALGLVESSSGEDERTRVLALTAAGEAALARARHRVWPGTAAAVEDLCDGDSAALLDWIARLEAGLVEAPLDRRVAAARPPALELVEWRDELAGEFKAINAEWIEAMFTLEDADRTVLDDPRGTIVDRGGTVLFVAAAGLGVVGACALKPVGGGAFELTKMGVRASARGLKAGEFLLAAMIERAGTMGIAELFLLTNLRCEAAIHLYEKLGFVHDAGVMARHGGGYCRCDVAMRYPGL